MTFFAKISGLLKKSFIFSFLSIASFSINTIVTAYGNRTFNKDDFGYISVLVAWTSVFHIFFSALNLQVQENISRSLNTNDTDLIHNRFSRYLGFFLLMGLIVSPMPIIFHKQLFVLLNFDALLPLVLLSINLFFGILNYMPIAYLRLMEEHIAVAWIGVGSISVRAIIAALSIFLGFRFYGFLLSQTIFTVVYFFGNIIFYRIKVKLNLRDHDVVDFSFKKFNTSLIKIKESFVFYLKNFLHYFVSAAIMPLLLFFGIIVGRYVLSADSSGELSTASMFGKILFYVIAMFSPVFFARITNNYTANKTEKSFLYKSLGVAFVLACLLGVIVYFMIPILVEQFLLGRYTKNLNEIRLYLVVSTFQVINNFSILFFIANKNFKYLYISLSIIIVGIIFSLFTIASVRELIFLEIIINILIFSVFMIGTVIGSAKKLDTI